MGISIGQPKYNTCLELSQLDYNLDKYLWGQANDIFVLVLTPPPSFYLALKSSCDLLIFSFPNYFLSCIFIFIYFLKLHQCWDCHILADCEVSHINLSQSPYEMSTIPEVLYVNIWEFSKLNFRDQKKLTIFFHICHSELVFSWEFSNYIYYIIAQYPPITNC